MKTYQCKECGNVQSKTEENYWTTSYTYREDEEWMACDDCYTVNVLSEWGHEVDEEAPEEA
jgi:hypothetical protein